MNETTISNPERETAVRGVVEWAASQDTQIARALAARWAIDLLADVTLGLSQVRIEAVRGLWAEGWSLKDISEALGISRARVHQIIEK